MSSMLKKPEKWVSTLAIFLLSLMIAWTLPRAFSFVRLFEDQIADIRVALLSPLAEQNEDIVILGITEDTLAKFPYRSPIDREQLASWLQAIEEKGARAIALDLLFDRPTEPAKDALFAEWLAAASVPVVVAAWTEFAPDPRVTPEQIAFQQDYLPATVIKARPHFIKDADGTARWIPPPLASPASGETPRLGLASAVAGALGLEVPGDRMEIAFRGRAEQEQGGFAVYPAHSAPVLLEPWIRGKVVLVGVSLPFEDRHRTPFSVIGGDAATMPGPWIHAHALAQILEGREAPRASGWLEAVIAVALVAIGMWVAHLDLAVWLRVVLATVCGVAFWLGAFFLYQKGGPLIATVMPTVALAGAFALTSAYSSSQHLREKRAIREAFGRYVAPAVVRQLEAEPERLKLGGELRELTYVFTDIAGFTSLSEHIEAEDLVRVLNEYLHGLTEIILKHEGTIDKFIGDAAVCLFNAPERQEDHAQRACLCALEIDAFAQAFARRQWADDVCFGKTRIGVHTGSAVVGNFGGTLRFDYTAIGDTVNTAARLEGANKYFGTRICISGATVSRCDGLLFRPIGDLVLKGKKEGIEVFEPLPPDSVDAPALEAYNAAYELMKKEDPRALQAFQALRRQDREDPLVGFHLARLVAGQGGRSGDSPKAEAGTLIVMQGK